MDLLPPDDDLPDLSDQQDFIIYDHPTIPLILQSLKQIKPCSSNNSECETENIKVDTIILLGYIHNIKDKQDHQQIEFHTQNPSLNEKIDSYPHQKPHSIKIQTADLIMGGVYLKEPPLQVGQLVNFMCKIFYERDQLIFQSRAWEIIEKKQEYNMRLYHLNEVQEALYERLIQRQDRSEDKDYHEENKKLIDKYEKIYEDLQKRLIKSQQENEPADQTEEMLIELVVQEGQEGQEGLELQEGQEGLELQEGQEQQERQVVLVQAGPVMQALQQESEPQTDTSQTNALQEQGN